LTSIGLIIASIQIETLLFNSSTMEYHDEQFIKTQVNTSTNMKSKKYVPYLTACFSITSLCALLLAGCQSAPDKTKSSSQPAPVVVSAPPAPVSAAENKPAFSPIRIKADSSAGFKDNNGNMWLPDQGFADGDTVERPELTITNAADQRIYQSERY